MTRYTYNENTRVSHLPQVDEVENSLNKFDFDPTTLTYDLRPLTLTLMALTSDHFFYTKLKTGIFTFLNLVILTFEL